MNIVALNSRNREANDGVVRVLSECLERAMRGDTVGLVVVMDHGATTTRAHAVGDGSLVALIGELSICKKALIDLVQ